MHSVNVATSLFSEGAEPSRDCLEIVIAVHSMLLENSDNQSTPICTIEFNLVENASTST